MATNSPMLDIMIEIATNESSGLLAIRAAGEVISADASFNLRMADAHGPSGHSTAAGMMEHMNAYECIVERVQAAWSSFKDEVAKSGVLNVEPHAAIEGALDTARRDLDGME
ncbi:hypothetical protein BH09MYX1_BH09MYX1_33730 [soil metagenome]